MQVHVCVVELYLVVSGIDIRSSSQKGLYNFNGPLPLAAHIHQSSATLQKSVLYHWSIHPCPCKLNAQVSRPYIRTVFPAWHLAVSGRDPILL